MRTNDESVTRLSIACRALGTILVLALSSIAPEARAQQYSVTVIDAPPQFAPLAINNRGEILGTVVDSTSLNLYPLLVSNGANIRLDQDFTVDSFNDRGQIAGATSSGGNIQAVIYDHGVYTSVGPQNSAAFSINQAGDVTGGFGYGDLGFQDAFVYSNGRIYSLYHNEIGGVYGVSINNKGDVLYAETGFYYFYEAATGSSFQLGDLNVWGAKATAMNDAGRIIGSAPYSYVSNAVHAVIYYRDGAVDDLGSLPGLWDDSRALAINNSGQIVGVSGFHTAFLYTEQTGMVALNELIPHGSGCSLQIANSINDNGQIVGLGVCNNKPVAFLLTPT